MEQETETPADAGSKTEALRTRIEAALQESLEKQWEEVLDQWTGAEAAEREAVWTYAANLRDRILNALLAADSQEALKRCLAVGYVEMKCHWTMLNTQIQHQTSRNGRPEEPLIYRATCVSLIVQALEPLLNREYVEGLTDFLAESLA
ncbi:MAG: hypothetical protein BRD51_00725 [Bacteroidetes bacterium SW_11_64_17]|jgi:hypothetical protein|nr:MAG: hypothetical protein BRD51_00725 [Bacteroidetes bacterium SW_11_64_17]